MSNLEWHENNDEYETYTEAGDLLAWIGPLEQHWHSKFHHGAKPQGRDYIVYWDGEGFAAQGRAKDLRAAKKDVREALESVK